MSHPQSYEILLFPEPEDPDAGAPEPRTAIRSAVVAATGRTGRSGYPRYTGEGLEADIDPASHTVEALLVDGRELDYSLTVRIAERIGGTEEPQQESGGGETAQSGDGGEPEEAQAGGTREPEAARGEGAAPDRPGSG
ncbi:hypothetical protein ABZY45_23585 [Streptomyces sp. NPDC006516]|uniref:hypothetical protein n=1 Tax=Streptomyces sp. NPDC006516 TaxID=3154309 RepID=UPI0033A9A3AC